MVSRVPDGVSLQTAFPFLRSELAYVLVGISDSASLTFRECLHELGNICGIKEVLPKSCTLSGSLLDIHLPVAFRRAYQGTCSRARIKYVRMDPARSPREIEGL